MRAVNARQQPRPEVTQQACAWCGLPTGKQYLHVHTDTDRGIRIVHHAELGDGPGCTGRDPLFDDLVDRSLPPAARTKLIADIEARGQGRVVRLKALHRRLKVKR